MGKDTYFIFDNIKQFLNNIENEVFPSYLIYGAYHLKEYEQINLIDTKESSSITNSKVVINVPMYAPIFKKRGNKVILINLNSNHIIARNKKSRIKSWLIRRMYNKCDVIMCLDKGQLKPLCDLGVTTKLVVNPLLIDTDTFNRVAARIKFGFKKYSPYYLSSGVDSGRDFSGLHTLDSPHPVIVLGRHNAVPYNQYAEILVKSVGGILNIKNGAGSSDLSGSTTVFEFLVMKKPVFINPQPWLKNFKSRNIYIYNNEDELEKLLWSRPEWIDEKMSFTFDRYLKKLKKILRI